MIAEFFAGLVVAACAAKQVGEVVEGVAFVVRVARNVWEWLRDRHGEKSGATASEAIRQIVAADPATLNEQARQAVEQEAGSLPAIEREVLLDYLTQVPGRVRATFSRPEDPEGKTVPAAWTIRSSDDLLPFLPPRLPEIRPGDSPAGAPQWELVERLGSGGFGEVWKARHRQSERQLTAFKFCLDPAAQRDLLAHELRLIETVQQHLRDHPHIVRLIDFDLAADRPWLRYEFILGQELGRWLRTQPSDPNKREEIVRDILHTLAQTLAPCHAGFDAEDGRRVRIVHRDLKPENVLIDSRGQLKVADFGIGQVQSRQALAQADEWTRYSRVGTGLSILASAFTPLYASPEQRRGEPPDPTDDVYALGVLAYQMLVGNLRAEPGPDLDDELKDLGISELIRQVLRKSLAARRERRWQDAGALSSALRQGGKAAAPSHGSRREVSAKDSPPSPIPGSPPVTHRVQPTDDLAAVVARLPEGAVVELEAGTYELREPLRIDKSLTLRGPDRDHCAIVSAAPEAVLVFEGKGHFGLEGITVRHVGTAWADTVVVNGGKVSIHRCRFTGAVRENGARGGSGLWLKGDTVGEATNCESLENELHGIEVAGQSRPQLTGNRCSKNKDCGIAYFGSAAGTAQNNHCEENERHGMYVGDQAQPQLTGNRCVKNKWSGIAYFGSATGTAQNNHCEENERRGIFVRDQARPQLIGNRCVKNKGSGIAYFGSAAGTAHNNHCEENESHAILLFDQAEPQLIGNRCVKNKGSGIAYYFGSAAWTAQNNRCEENKHHGIDVGGQAQPQLTGNRCVKNKGSGIAYADSAAGTAQNNHCEENEYHGILVRHQAQPQLTVNRCVKNKGSGIAYFGSAAGTAHNNHCEENGQRGIFVGDQARPQLIDNRSVNNGAEQQSSAENGVIGWIVVVSIAFIGIVIAVLRCR